MMIVDSAHTTRSDPSSIKCQRSDFRRRILGLVLCFAGALAYAGAAQAQELSNDTLRLKLNVTLEGIPVIEEAVWEETGETVFRDLGTPEGLSEWIPEGLNPEGQTATAFWAITEGDDLTTAEATCQLANKIFITWIVELPKQGQLFRVHVRLTNRGKKARAFDSFPAWLASWDVAGQSQWARWWRSVEYERVEQPLNDVNRVRLGSRMHSSDDEDGGVNPYWVVGGSDSRIYFGLEWCGGWTAKIQGLDNGFKFSVGLPAEETQLVLTRGETIDGPALLVTPMRSSDDINGRATWMSQRSSWGQTLYSGPPLSFPLTYNHWYAVRQKVDDSFLNRQIAAMSPFSFDAFIIDAGWFAEGRWKPDPAKFQSGEFAQMLASLKANGVKPGLWSTPQYVSTSNRESALAIEEPPVFSNFIGGYLVDMAQAAFPNYLTDHVQLLRNKYSVDYWKYDQPLFSQESRAGAMKNVIGFQNAMKAVRQANPDLMIENCLNGGRMINEFTLLATQTSWLQDLGSSGIPDPRGNIFVALNAMDFIFPWAALRFTINLENIDQDDDEQLRLYSRSAMAGMWGISTDLSRITERQQGILLKEIENYRRLNRLKFACVYELQLPNDSADVAGVTFYGRRRLTAGVLLYRWQRDGAFDQRVVLLKLRSSVTYRVVDVDTGSETIASGRDLMRNGIIVPFSARRQSALLFIEPLYESPKPAEP
jgi:melibiase-like protein